MKLEQQVVSLELAQKMKELGFKQESLFYWNLWNGQGDDFLFQIHYNKPVLRGDGVLPKETCSAYTVAELGEFLDKATSTPLIKAYIEVMDFNPMLMEAIPLAQHMLNLAQQPDIAAKMLIYLVENKLITI